MKELENIKKEMDAFFEYMDKEVYGTKKKKIKKSKEKS